MSLERVGRVELRIIGLEDRWAPLATIYPHCTIYTWSRHHESNVDLSLRRTPYYPLYYSENLNLF